MKKGLLTMLALLSMGSSAFAQTAQTTVNVPTVVRKAGPVKEVSVVATRQAKVKIELTEFTNYRDLQFDLTLPEGITVVSEVVGENEVIQVETTKTSHKVAANAVADNKVRFVVYNEGNVGEDDKVIKLGDGIIVEIPVNVSSGYTGTNEGLLDNIKTSDDAATKSIDLAVANFNFRAVLLGDVNDDGKVTNSDQVAIVMHLLDEPSTPFVFEAADMEYDASKPNEITNSDAISLADKLLEDSSPAKAFVEEDVVSDVETEIEPD